MKHTIHMPLIAALAGALCATSVLMLDTADAETRVIFKVKRPGGEVLEVFRGRPGTGVRAEAREFAAETEGDQVIVKTVKRNGEIVSKEKERESQTSERRTRDTDDDTAQAERPRYREKPPYRQKTAAWMLARIAARTAARVPV